MSNQVQISLSFPLSPPGKSDAPQPAGLGFSLTGKYTPLDLVHREPLNCAVDLQPNHLLRWSRWNSPFGNTPLRDMNLECSVGMLLINGIH